MFLLNNLTSNTGKYCYYIPDKSLFSYQYVIRTLTRQIKIVAFILFLLLFQNAGLHFFSFFVMLLGSGVLLENTTIGSDIVPAIRESMMNLIMQSQSESTMHTLNMIQESVSRICFTKNISSVSDAR